MEHFAKIVNGFTSLTEADTRGFFSEELALSATTTTTTTTTIQYYR